MGGNMPGKKHPGAVGADIDLRELASRFELEGEIAAAEPYGSGHIHETYRVRMGAGSDPGYILQRVNRHIFTDVPRLMENIVRVTGHMRRRLASVPGSDPGREVLTVVLARSGASYYMDGAGEYWRCFRFIEHRELGERPGGPGQAHEAGRLFGRFLKLLGDLPAPPLHETIPRFHDVDRRLDDFHQALAEDTQQRRAAAAAQIGFISCREEGMRTTMAQARARGLPLRVTHNDTKFNNVLFDPRGRGVCVIDLDTVMPGYVLYDFGDAIRSAASSAREDQADPARVHFRMEIFREFAAGYLGELGDAMTAVEAGHLAFSARLMTFVVGLRFLTDHLAGDVYFKTAKPGQNLQRARAQFALLFDMERRFAEMEDAVCELAGIKEG
jgi:hypothetical protein